MKLAEKIVEEALKRGESISEQIEMMKKKDVYIWGTGLAGGQLYFALKEQGVKVIAFTDNDHTKWTQYFQGVLVISPSEIPKEAYVVIAANVLYGIHKYLKEEDIEYTYIDPCWFMSSTGIKAIDVVRKNASRVNLAYEMIDNEYSRKVFYNTILHRCCHDLNLIWDIYEKNQYFNNSAIQKVSGAFVDCGAYIGDTLVEFMRNIENVENYHYYAFEMDSDNFNELNLTIKKNNWKHIDTYNLGVWNKHDFLSFEMSDLGGKVAGHLVENGWENRSEVDCLDSVLQGKKIDYIKMDIEGAEINALMGAKTIIQKYHPTLMISAYHELEHLWEIPIMIKDISANYKIEFAHHMWNMCDTVCYGKIEKM